MALFSAKTHTHVRTWSALLWRTCRGALTVGKPAARLCWCSIAAAFSRVSSGPRTATANRGVQAAHRTPPIHRLCAPVASVRQPC
eukprot:scaffold1279_cov31-Phaeocystis_antarctica.AAC.1